MDLGLRLGGIPRVFRFGCSQIVQVRIIICIHIYDFSVLDVLTLCIIATWEYSDILLYNATNTSCACQIE